MQMGDASEAVNVANGHMVCGCDNVAYCRVSSSEFLELWVKYHMLQRVFRLFYIEQKIKKENPT